MDKKYIDVDDVLEQLFYLYDSISPNTLTGNDARIKILQSYKTIENLPAADVQEVVRCKDCKMYTDNIDDPNLRKGFCDRIAWQCYDRRNPDDFCNYGVRKRG